VSGAPPRLLFYSHNGVGVGHFRRQLRLAEAFRTHRPDASVLLVTGSHAAGAFAGPLGFDYVSLPSIQMVDRYENWRPLRLGMPIRDLMRMRADLLRRTVRRFAPDVLVADFMPAGPYGGLLGALEELALVGGRAVAGFRDIIDEPAFVRDLWRRTGVYDVLEEHYAAICVYGAREVMDYEGAYGLDGELSTRLHYVGYLGRPGSGTAAPGAGLSDGRAPVLIACTGGGVDGGALLEGFIDAVQVLAPRLGGSRLVVGGPLLSEPELCSLRARAGNAEIEVARFIPELDRRIASSDLVVTMPGYNTTCELLSSRARAIAVPRSGPSREQRMRAEQLSRWSRARSLEPVGLDAVALADAIEAALAEPPPPPPPISLDGLGGAVRLLESLASGDPVTVPA